MNVDEYKTWLSRNVGKGGKRPLSDPYNKAKKGTERYLTAQEYASKDVKEFHHYPENKDIRKDDDDDQKQNESSQSQQQNRNNNRNSGRSASHGATNLAQSVVRNLIPKVVLVVVGSIVVVQTYRTMKAKEAQATPVVVRSTCNWNADYSAATFTLWDANDKAIKELPGNITFVEVAATCTVGGSKTYTATVEDDGKSYTDSKVITFGALGHSFDEGTPITMDDGKEGIDYECVRCHEHFITAVSTSEHDDSTRVILTDWKWNDDYTSASVELAWDDGTFIKELPAVITSAEISATCTEGGVITYTGTVEDEDTTYTDKRYVTTDPLGHSFDEGTPITMDDGKEGIDYECERCHEHFIIATSAGEHEEISSALADLKWEHNHSIVSVELIEQDEIFIHQQHYHEINAFRWF